jgi:hypothetical protein
VKQLYIPGTRDGDKHNNGNPLKHSEEKNDILLIHPMTLP